MGSTQKRIAKENDQPGRIYRVETPVAIIPAIVAGNVKPRSNGEFCREILKNELPNALDFFAHSIQGKTGMAQLMK